MLDKMKLVKLFDNAKYMRLSKTGGVKMSIKISKRYVKYGDSKTYALYYHSNNTVYYNLNFDYKTKIVVIADFAPMRKAGLNK